MSEKEALSKLEFAEKLLSKNPNNVAALKNKGLYLGKLRRYSEAIAVYSKIIELDENMYDIYAQRACLYSITGEANLAMKDIDFLSNNMDKVTGDFEKLVIEKLLESIQYYKETNQKIQNSQNNSKSLGSLLTRTNNISMSNTAMKEMKIESNSEQMAILMKKFEEMEKQNKTLIDKVLKLEKDNENNKSELQKLNRSVVEQSTKSAYFETHMKIINERVTQLEQFKNKFPDEFLRYKEKEKAFEDALKRFDDERKEKIKNYLDGFLAESSMVYTSSLVVKSGNLAIDVGNDWVDLGTTLISYIPLVGEFFSDGISWAYEKAQETLLTTKADNLIGCYKTITDFEQSMKYIAISAILNSKKQNDIVAFAEKEIEEWWGFFLKIQGKIEGFIQDCKDLLIVNMYEKSITDQYKLGAMDCQKIFDVYLQTGLLIERLSKDKKGAEEEMIKFIRRELQEEVKKEEVKEVKKEVVKNNPSNNGNNKNETNTKNNNRENHDKQKEGKCGCCIIF